MIEIKEIIDTDMNIITEQYYCTECDSLIYTEIIGDKYPEEKNEAINDHVNKCKGVINE